MLAESKYLPNLTFPRFILALMVVIHHFGMNTQLFLNEQGDFIPFVRFSNLAVSFFFFLSGFILFHNYHFKKIEPIKFWKKRFSRLYPIFFITLWIVAIYWRYYDYVGIPWKVMLFHSAGLQAWLPREVLNYNFPAWSLSVEFFLYLLFPLILLFYKRFKLVFILTTIALYIVGVSVFHYYSENMWTPENFVQNTNFQFLPPWHLNTFMAGILGGLFFNKIKTKTINKWIPTVLSIVGFSLFFLILAKENILGYRISKFAATGSLAPIFMLICIGLSLEKNIIYKLFKTQAFQLLGNISYGMYLWQFPAFLIFIHLFNNHQPQLVEGVFWFYLLFLLIVSILSFKFIEEPLRKKINNKLL